MRATTPRLPELLEDIEPWLDYIPENSVISNREYILYCDSESGRTSEPGYSSEDSELDAYNEWLEETV